MREGSALISPRQIKENLRSTLGAHIAAYELGHYLDFNVVVIPPGRHVTEFPTADAAFHPWSEAAGTSEEGDEIIEIRIVPWLIVKISPTEQLSRRLDEEVENFWIAGVEQVWEVCVWNRSLVVRDRSGEKKRYAEDKKSPACAVLPDFRQPIHEWFEGVDDEESLPGSVDEEDSSWRIEQPVAGPRERRLIKDRVPDFVPAPEVPPLPGMEEEKVHKGALRSFVSPIIDTWTGRGILVLVVTVLATAVVHTVLETKRNRQRPEIRNGSGWAGGDADTLRLELAKSTIRGFLSESDIGSRADWVRATQGIRERMAAFAATRPFKASTVSVYGDAEQEHHGGIPFLKVPIWIEGNEIDAYLEDLGSKGFLLDWESFVGFNGTTLEEFEEKKPGPTLFRVQASASDRFVGAFEDRKMWYAAALHFPDSDRRLSGYYLREDAGFEEFRQLLDGEYRRPLILELDWPDSESGSGEPKVIIRRVVSHSWLKS